MQDKELELGFSPDVWATIEAAEIQAEAARSAAEFAGYAALGGAGIQLLAAFIAAVVAIRAATRQVRLAERNHRNKVEAYRHRQAVVTRNVGIQASIQLARARKTLAFWKEEKGSQILKTPVFSQPPEWATDQWENHALLGDEFISSLHHVRMALSDVIQFQREVRVNKLRTDSHAENYTYKGQTNTTKQANGIVQVDLGDPETAAEQNVTVLERLNIAIANLIEVIDPKRKIRNTWTEKPK